MKKRTKDKKYFNHKPMCRITEVTTKTLCLTTKNVSNYDPVKNIQ